MIDDLSHRDIAAAVFIEAHKVQGHLGIGVDGENTRRWYVDYSIAESIGQSIAKPGIERSVLRRVKRKDVF